MFDTADRLEIINAISLYSIYYDERRYDEWLDLFTEDATLQTPARVFNGREDIRLLSAFGERLYARGAQGRHLMANIAITDQSVDRATVVAYALVVASESNGDASVNVPVHYQGEVVKEGDRWRIEHWKVVLDRPLD